MRAEGMCYSGEREAAGSAVGTQPAPVVQPRIGEVQASALGDQRRIEICVQLTWAPGLSTGCSRVCRAGRAFRLPVNKLS